MLPIVVNCSRSDIIWHMQYMVLKSPKHKLNKKNNRSPTFWSSIRKTTNIGNLLRFHIKHFDVNYSEELERDINLCSCGNLKEGTGRLHATWIESRVGAIAIKELQYCFSSWLVQKFLPRTSSVHHKKHYNWERETCRAELMWTEMFCLCRRLTAAIMLPLEGINLVAKISTNTEISDLWRSIVVSRRKKKINFEKEAFRSIYHAVLHLSMLLNDSCFFFTPKKCRDWWILHLISQFLKTSIVELSCICAFQKILCTFLKNFTLTFWHSFKPQQYLQAW